MEPHGLCPGDERRPDGATSIPWARGKILAWDVTCPNTFAVCNVALAATGAATVSNRAEVNKALKYFDINQTVTFTPFAIETTGAWGAEALSLIRILGARIHKKTKDKRSSEFLFQRMSIAIQRGNAGCILHTLGDRAVSAD